MTANDAARLRFVREGEDVLTDPAVTIQPGRDYVLTFEGRPCTRTFGLDAAQDNQVGLKVIADHWTHVDMICEPAR